MEGHDKVGEAEGLVAVGALDEGDVLASALLTDSRQVLGEADLEGSEEGARVSVGVSSRLPGVLQEGAEARGAEGPVHQRDDLQDIARTWLVILFTTALKGRKKYTSRASLDLFTD